MINKLIFIQIFLFFAYLDEYFDNNPIKKKNKKEAKDAPTPNLIFSKVKNFLKNYLRKKLYLNTHEDLNK